MKKEQVITDPKAERSRKMNELLSKMAECFNEAFPSKTDFIKWLADANEMIYENAQSKRAEDAKRLTWWFGFDLLPALVRAKTKEKRNAAIIETLEEVAADERLYRGLPFLNYLTLDSCREWMVPEDMDKEKAKANTLNFMAELGQAYADIRKKMLEENKKEWEEKRRMELAKEKLDKFLDSVKFKDEEVPA